MCGSWAVGQVTSQDINWRGLSVVVRTACRITACWTGEHSFLCPRRNCTGTTTTGLTSTVPSLPPWDAPPLLRSCRGNCEAVSPASCSQPTALSSRTSAETTRSVVGPEAVPCTHSFLIPTTTVTLTGVWNILPVTQPSGCCTHTGITCMCDVETLNKWKLSSNS